MYQVASLVFRPSPFAVVVFFVVVVVVVVALQYNPQKDATKEQEMGEAWEQGYQIAHQNMRHSVLFIFC